MLGKFAAVVGDILGAEYHPFALDIVTKFLKAVEE
jgi:hypothetical protein